MKSWDILQSGWTSKRYVMKDPDTKDHVLYVALGHGLVIGEHFERGDGHTEREGGHTKRDHTIRSKWKAQKTWLQSTEHCLS